MPKIEKVRSRMIIEGLQKKHTLTDYSFNALYILSLCLPKADCTKLLTHIVQHHDLVVQPEYDWVNDNYGTLSVGKLVDEPDASISKNKEFIQQAYTQLISKRDGQEHHFFVSLRVTTNDGNNLPEANPDLYAMTQRFCSRAQRVMACEPDPSASLLQPINTLLQKMKGEFDNYPHHQFDIVAYRNYGWGDTLNINGYSRGKQVVYTFETGNDNSKKVLNHNQHGHSARFSGTIERGCQIAVIDNTRYERWNGKLSAKIAAAAIVTADKPRIIGAQFIPATLTESTHAEDGNTENNEKLAALEIKKVASKLFYELKTQSAHNLGFFHTDKTFTLSRLRAITADSLVEYLLYLSLERDMILNKKSPIAKALDTAIEFGKTLMEEKFKEQLTQRLTTTNGEGFDPIKRNLLLKLLAKSQSHETSASYWLTQCLEYYEACDRYGNIAQIATNNYLLDQVYQCRTDDDLEPIITLIGKLGNHPWPDSFKTYLHDLDNTIKTNRQTYLPTYAI